MHVLIVVPWDQERGGVAAVVGHVATYLTARGHRVTFLHPGDGLCPIAHRTRWGFEGFRLNLREPLVPEAPLRSRIAFALTAPLALLRLRALLRRLEVDVVNIHFPGPAGIYFALLRRLGLARLVVSVHGTDVMRTDGKAHLPPSLRFLMGSADRIVSPSAGFLAACSSRLGKHAAPAIVIHNGADLRVFDASAEPEVQRDPDLLLCAATFDQWKGIDLLLDAVAMLRAEWPAIRLRLAGDGPLRAMLVARVASLGLQDAVTFLGNVAAPELATQMRACGVFVLPSRSEPFGIVVAEALACGAPIVATRVGGVPEILDDGAFGVLVPPEDAAALADGLRRVMKDQALRDRLSALGPARARGAFTWDLTGARYERELVHLLEERALARSEALEPAGSASG